jgi:hypothetical protein
MKVKRLRPAGRSGPTAVSGASRKKQFPSSGEFVALDAEPAGGFDRSAGVKPFGGFVGAGFAAENRHAVFRKKQAAREKLVFVGVAGMGQDSGKTMRDSLKGGAIGPLDDMGSVWVAEFVK